MRAETEYRLRAEWIAGGSVKAGDWLPFHTGMLDGNFTPVSIAVPRVNGSSVSGPVLTYSAVSQGGSVRPLATDLEGRVIWYLRSPDFITRVTTGGRFLALGEGSNSVNGTREKQLLHEVDLAGNIVRETNAGAVAEQLA
jgi:hypothetical protein